MTDPKSVKELVRERYGARARQGEACCDPSTDAYPNIYTKEELTTLPLEVVAVSAGCGNPTALAGLQPGEVVLDLGSGGGIDCFLAAQQVGDSGKVYGLDMTPEMVELARRNARNLPMANVEFLLGEIEDIPLGDASVDVVISNCVVCLSPDKDAVFREVSRVLRPGGRLHISDMATQGPLPQEVCEDAEQWVSCVSGTEPIDEYVARLMRAGFVAVEVTPERPGEQIEPGLPALVSAQVTARKPD